MFRVTEDPSSGSLVQCLAKNYKNDSIVSVDMDKVGVMAAYCDLLCGCDLREVGGEGMDWIELSQVKDRWRVFFECVNEPLGSIKCREFLD